MTIRPDLPLGAFAQAQARARLQDVCERMRAVRKDQSAEPVHALRVAIRRFSSLLDVFPECFSPNRAAKCRKRLRRIRKAAGEVRDRDIALVLSAPGEGGAPDASLEELTRGRRDAAKALRRAVAKKRRKRIFERAKAALRLRKPKPGGEESWRPEAGAGENAARRLPEVVAQLFDAGREVLREPEGSSSALHALRLDCKRVRYTLELFEPCYGPELEDRLSELKRLQDILGDINDCRASVDHASDEAASARLERRKARLVCELRRYWFDNFDAPGQREGWMLELARRAAAAP